MYPLKCKFTVVKLVQVAIAVIVIVIVEVEAVTLVIINVLHSSDIASVTPKLAITKVL